MFCTKDNLVKAMAFETARTISTLQVSKVRRMNAGKEKYKFLHKSRKMLKQILEKDEQ